MQAKRLVVTALVVGFLVVCASAVRVEALKSFFIGSGGQTAAKPQSKLWYHDGSWWAILPDGTNLYFYRMVNGVFNKETFPDALVDTASGKRRADVLWNEVDNTLFVLVYHTPTTSDPNQKLYKYTYTASTMSYTREDNFPVVLPFLTGEGSDSGATMAQDSTGKLWIVYIERVAEFYWRSSTPPFLPVASVSSSMLVPFRSFCRSLTGSAPRNPA